MGESILMGEMLSKKFFIKSISKVGSWTLLSRILGLIRDSVIARFFGAGISSDAFMVAFRIPNLLRRLLAEGALSVAFVPVFSQIHAGPDKEKLKRAYPSVFFVFSLLLILITCLGMIFSPVLIHIFAPGFSGEKAALAVRLTRFMFPFIFFIGTSSVAVGVLNVLGSFSVPAAAPVVLNIFVIAGTMIFLRTFEEPIFSAAIGVLLGGFAQWIFQIMRAHQLGYPLKMSWHWDETVAKIFRLMGPTVLGVAVYHLNILVLQILASLLPDGSVTYLYYSDRFLEFPLGIFAVSIATVALPQLSEHAARKDERRLVDTLRFALKLVAFVSIPATLGLIVLSRPILALFFEYGRFTAEDTIALSHVVMMSCAGLFAVGGVRVTVQVFYSLKDIKTPIRVAFICFLINAGLGWIFMSWLGVCGLPLASSVAAWFQWVLLMFFLRKRLGIFQLSQMVSSIRPMLISACLMGSILWPVMYFFNQLDHPSMWIKAIFVLAGIFLGIGTYFMACFWLGVKELKSWFEKLRNRSQTRDDPSSIPDTL